MEFAYNNNFHSSISMAPYESLYGKRCRFPIALFEMGEPSLLHPELIYKILEKVHIILIGCQWSIVGNSLKLIICEGIRA